MNTQIKQLLLAGLIFSTTFAYSADNSELFSMMKKKFPQSQISSVKPVESIPGLVEITAGKNILYSSLDGKILVIGHLYDTKRNKDITQEKLTQLAKIKWSDLNLKNAFTLKKGTGEHEFSIFSDIDCYYCKKLEKELLHMTNFTARIFLVSPEILQKRKIPSQKLQTLNGILCSDKPGEQYTNLMVNGNQPPKPSKSCNMINVINQNTLFFVKAGLIGTPNLIAKNGKINPGFLPAPALTKWIELNNK